MDNFKGPTQYPEPKSVSASASGLAAASGPRSASEPGSTLAPASGRGPVSRSVSASPSPSLSPSESHREKYGHSDYFPDCFDTTSCASSQSSEMSPVENAFYRSRDLKSNHIHLRPLREVHPEHITTLIRRIREDRPSTLSFDQIRQDPFLNALWMGNEEKKTQRYFGQNIFPMPGESDSLQCDLGVQIAKAALPHTRSPYGVSQTKPDMLYGYKEGEVFTKGRQAELISMNNEIRANNEGLMYPFFCIEAKGDGPSGRGRLWVATNQCLGGSASCVKIVEHLNQRLKDCRDEEAKEHEAAVCILNFSDSLFIFGRSLC